MSTFRLFEIGKSALLASRAGMDVTGHNVANAATPGYSRQEANLTPIIQVKSQITGVGVKMQDIRRMRDVFLDAVLRNEAAKKESFASEVKVLEHMQVIVHEPSDKGLSQAIDDFWAGWHDLASDSGSSGARAQVMERGRSLCDTFRHIGGQLDSLCGDVENEVLANVQRVNDLSENIALLNREIIRSKARGESSADLEDKRDLLLDEIAEITGATFSFTQDGSARVGIAGFPLVDGVTHYDLQVAFKGDTTEFSWIGSDGLPIPMEYMGGRLGGFKIARDQRVLGFKRELGAFLNDLSSAVNEQYALGFSATDGDGPVNFFHILSEDPLATVKVEDEIVKDPMLIRASFVENDPLNGENAIYIAKVIGEAGDSESSYNDRWMGIVGKLGAVGQKSSNGFDIQELLVKDLANRRDGVSGIQIDEEVAVLIRQQHCFNAASRVISMADEMLDTIINRMG